MISHHWVWYLRCLSSWCFQFKTGKTLSASKHPKTPPLFWKSSEPTHHGLCILFLWNDSLLLSGGLNSKRTDCHAEKSISLCGRRRSQQFSTALHWKDWVWKKRDPSHNKGCKINPSPWKHKRSYGKLSSKAPPFITLSSVWFLLT